MIIGYKIKLDSIEKVKKFTSVVLTFENDIDLMQGRYVIDGKSLMAIFSLDLTSVLKVLIHDTSLSDFAKFEKIMEEFRVYEDKNN